MKLNFKPFKTSTKSWRLIAVTFATAALISQAIASPPHLPGGDNCKVDGMSPYIQVNGVGSVGQGSGMVYGDINKNGKLDLVLMAYDNPAGANTFRYKIGWDVDFSNGTASSWTNYKSVTGVGHEGNGAGITLHDIDGNGTLEMVLMAYDNPAGANNFRYKIGWNLSNSGNATSWSNYIQVNGVGDEGSGAGIAIADINNNGTDDIVLMACNQNGRDDFRYRIGWDINNSGVATSWTANYIQVTGVGHNIQGADIVLADVNFDDELDMILMAYDNPNQWNNYRYKIGWSIQNNGRATDWSRYYMIKGMGYEGEGAGLAWHFDNTHGSLLSFMVYDAPGGANNFRYTILPVTSSGATYGIADDYPPTANNVLDVPTSHGTNNGTRLFNLNMSEVQQTANDALAGYILGCFFAGIFGNNATTPVCWCNHPDYQTNASIVWANAKAMNEIIPDILVAAVAWYVDENMGYVGDNINNYVLNTFHNLNYYAGAGHTPAYYTIHYTQPTTAMINQLQAQDPAWANEYNDGNLYHGDCEDYAILRHALLRALGFDRNYIWNGDSPGHEFNVVLYQGALRIMDYGYIYDELCRPSGITVNIYGAWNQVHSFNNSDYTKNFPDYVLPKIFPDRCSQGFGWMFTRRPHSEFENTTKCCD